jgi:hypothetical protein
MVWGDLSFNKNMWRQAQQEVRQYWFIDSWIAAYIQVQYRVTGVHPTGLTIARGVGQCYRAPPELWPRLGGEEVRGPTSVAVPVDGTGTASNKPVLSYLLLCLLPQTTSYLLDSQILDQLFSRKTTPNLKLTFSHLTNLGLIYLALVEWL